MVRRQLETESCSNSKVSNTEAFCYDGYMNKKIILIVVGAILVLIAAIVTLLIVTSNMSPYSSTSTANQGKPIPSMSTKQALGLAHTATCLSNYPPTKATVVAIPGLSEDSGIYAEEIYDVPAGTNVDVNIATYDAQSSTIGGSLAYAAPHGSYNFLLQKQSDGWRYVAFIRCG